MLEKFINPVAKKYFSMNKFSLKNKINDVLIKIKTKNDEVERNFRVFLIKIVKKLKFYYTNKCLKI
jgi:hypothetical protein